MRATFILDKITKRKFRFSPQDENAQLAGSIYLNKAEVPQGTTTIVVEIRSTTATPPQPRETITIV